MKEIRRSSIVVSPLPKIFFSLSFILASAAGAGAQLNADSESPSRRITRARALSAAGHLPAARSELESLLREPGADGSVREIAQVLLVGVYLDQADYVYAENTLNEVFRKRTAQDDGTTRAYFAIAGQIINGVRAHVERYRALGLNINDAELPAEAVSDLEKLRGLLEKVIGQGKSLRDENGKSMEASALLEDAATLRVRVARNDGERAQWQREVAEARQRMMGTERRVAGTNPVAANNTAAPVVSAPATAVPTAMASAAPANNSTTPAPSTTQKTSPAMAAHGSPPPTTTQAAPPANSTKPDTANATPAATPAQGSTATDDSVPAQSVEVGSLLAKVVEKVDPSYPATAKSARVTGKVTVFLQLDEKGAVQSVKRTDGPEMLRRAAEDAARRWKFRPTLIDGQPVRVSGYVSFNFTL
ncbi:MAG: TonB family protein [Acidobacteriota bacterium]|nr:TonB family protein [Acidobacteriota bacterium]